MLEYCISNKLYFIAKNLIMNCYCHYNPILAWITIVSVIIALMVIITSTRYDYFGDDNRSKLKAFKRVNINVFISFGIIFIIIAGCFELISGEMFKYFFITGLTSLGIKLNSDFKDINKRDDY